MEKSGINFRPFKGLVVLTIPKEETIKLALEYKNQVLKEKRDDHIRQGKSLVVVATGEGVDFVKLDDKVVLSGMCRVQELDVDGEIYFVVRESDILGITNLW